MERVVLEAELREVGKGPAGRLRRKGLVPAVLYGGADRSGIPIAVSQRNFLELLRSHGRHALIEIRVSGGTQADPETVIVREVQRRSGRDQLLHIDFQRVSLREKIRTEVLVVLTGEERLPPGAVVQQLMRSMEVECLPGDIPERITIDVSGLEPGGQVLVSDVSLPGGVIALNDPDEVVATVLHGGVREEAEEEEPEESEAEQEEPE